METALKPPAVQSVSHIGKIILYPGNGVDTIA